MRALVFTAPGTVELLDVPEPDPAPGDVLVQVRMAGICGSELHGALRPGFRKPPLIMGHEFAGTGPDGEAVVINPILSCGRCEQCRRGLRHICRERQIIGVHRAGGFAERAAVPASALRPVPPDLPWEAAALSGGADRVDVSDLSPDRLAAARRLGAGAAGTSLSGEYDVVMDAVGSAATRAASVAHQRPEGVAVWLGLAEEEAGFDATALVRSEKRVLGSFAYRDEEFAHATALIREWDLTWAADYPLAAGAEIFTDLMNGGLQPVKALLRP